MENLDIKKLIGDLEMMVAAAEPGVVITEGMSVRCSLTLLKAIAVLKLDGNTQNLMDIKKL